MLRKGKRIKLGLLADKTLTIHDAFEMSSEELTDRAAVSSEATNGELTCVSEQITRRDAAFEIRLSAKNAEKRWRADGLTNEDIEMIQEKVDAVRYTVAKS